MNTQIRKLALRQSIIAAREKMPSLERARASQAITHTLCGLASYRKARAVLAYLNFGAELEAELFVQQALIDGKQVYLPKVNRATKQLDVYRISDLRHDVAPGTWEIREPIAERCGLLADLGEIDFTLLPGVAFSRDGSRLGYGGGFYDKLLPSMPHRPVRVAGAFSMQVVDKLPLEPFDQKIDWLVTEHEVIACGQF